MNKDTITREIERIEKHLFDSANWKEMKLSRQWAKSFPEDSGVYMLFEVGRLVYVGESGSLSGRVMDMLNSQHHTVRRALGELRFKDVPGYMKATSSIKYPEHIEKMVEETMKGFKISVLPIPFGRKEFEEHIESKYKPELNRKGKRGRANG
jgi:excinuclease UvrABC nuclease subunit